MNILNSQSISPNLLAFIPLFYVAWADSVLSPSEVALIQQKIEEMPWLNPEEKAMLYEWCDPANPPLEEQFQEWVNLIQTASKEMEASNRQSLADLGLQMANTGISKEDQLWSTPQARQALEDIEEVLGIVSLKEYRNILSEQQREQESLFQDQPSFDHQAMNALIDGEQAPLIQKIKVLLSDPAFELVNYRYKDEYREKVLEWCHILASHGYGSAAYPEAYGGKGDMNQYIALFKTLGYHDLSLLIKFGVHFGLFGGSVFWLGTERHHKRHLEAIGKLELPGCFAMTETGHGSNVRQLETTATYDVATDEFVIHSPSEAAGKEYIGNAMHSKIATVFAQLYTQDKCYGVHAFLVPLRDDDHETLSGITIKDCGYKLGLNGVDNGRIWFNEVRIPRENLLNKFGDVDESGNYTSPIESDSRRFFTMLGTLVGGRVCVPQAGISATKVGLTIAIKHGLKRRQFGPANEAETLLLDYPSHQRRLMPLLAKTYALDFALQYLSQRYVSEEEEDGREVETLAAALKSYATWHTTASLQECREACGGKGYLHENRIADLKADTDIFTTFEGDNTVLLQLVAKGLLTKMKEEFEDLNWLGMAKFVLGEVSFSLVEKRESAMTSEAHLLDSQFHVKIFQNREKHLLKAVAKKLRNLLGMKLNSYDAFLRCQNELIALGLAYAERITIEQFVKKIEGTKEDSLKVVLKDLCDLYALHTIEEHSAWYLEKGYLSANKTQAIRKEVDRLCLKVRQSANCFVDSFGIPDQSLAAPIAFG